MLSRSFAVLQSVPVATGALLMIGGSLVISTWIVDVAWLKSISPGWVTMNVCTAACFILSGASLCCLASEQAGVPARLAGRVCAAIVTLVALLTVGEHLSGPNLGIDQVLIEKAATAADPASPGWMSATTAFSFLLTGTALLGLNLRNRQGHRAALALALLIAFIGLLSIASYLYGAPSLYAFSPISFMPLHTGALFVAASLGILCSRPDKGPFGMLTATGIGSSMARRILPLALVLPLGVGWLRLEGERAGFYGFEFGLALVVSLNAFLFASLMWISAVNLNRADADRKRAEESLRRNAASLSNAQRIANMGNWDLDIKTTKLHWSDQIYRIFPFFVLARLARRHHWPQFNPTRHIRVEGKVFHITAEGCFPTVVKG